MSHEIFHIFQKLVTVHSPYLVQMIAKNFGLIKIDLFLTEPTYPYPEHIVYEYRFPNENRIERWPLDQCTRYPNSAESNSPPLLWESAGSSPEYLMNSATAPRSSRLANIYFLSNKLSGSLKTRILAKNQICLREIVVF